MSLESGANKERQPAYTVEQTVALLRSGDFSSEAQGIQDLLKRGEANQQAVAEAFFKDALEAGDMTAIEKILLMTPAHSEADPTPDKNSFGPKLRELEAARSKS